MHDVTTGLYTSKGAPVALQGVDIVGELLGGHARVRVRQRYRNAEAQPIEAVYVFPLPSDATLTAFSLECAGRQVRAQLQEREKAFQTYDDALMAGHGAALLDQERPNVFTAQVGNLLPGEETLVEVEFLQALTVEEGGVRWSLPTLVAPRYIPGASQGDRTGHGVAEPTPRVPDADRISPPVGDARYGLSVELLIALGREVVVDSPSHALSVTPADGGVRVRLARPAVALDRDLVLDIRGPDAEAPFTPLVTHRRGEAPGTFALTVVPDLLGLAHAPRRQEVVFVVDVSGSMSGESLTQAQGALRLCLRHLREGDLFNILVFSNDFRRYQREPVPFTQRTLEGADAWVAALVANGGTELLEPLQDAVRAVPSGVVVLLTDGQVGNEAEILQAVLAVRQTTRVYSFGIGTNVSDVLLKDLARQTGGAVEFIHPGERIDDKVVAQFSRALAPRVTDVEVRFEGVEAEELAPAEPPPLVDGTPWSLFGRYGTPGRGTLVLKGRAGAETFSLRVPLDLPAQSERPAVEKLWAAERIRGWQSAQLVGRRAESLRERNVQLALAHGLVTPYTSFVVVEERTGERRASAPPETRVIPVHAPAGWAMFGAPRGEAADKAKGGSGRARVSGARPGGPPPARAAMPLAPPAPAPARSVSAAAPAPATSAPSRSQKKRESFTESSKDSFKESFTVSVESEESAERPSADAFAAPRAEFAPSVLEGAAWQVHDADKALPAAQASGTSDVELLGRQLASGLWAGEGAGSEPVRQARATALALLELLRQGITSGHALHGTQVKKAVEALLALGSSLEGAPEVAELALGVAWLVSAGPRTRGRIAQAARPLANLHPRLADEAALRQHLDALAARRG
jgi:Ca-activated chloride channel homolog